MPHDVVIDADGHAWYTDFGAQIVGELDPKTGKVVDHKLILLQPDQPKGSLDIELDPDGNLWVGMSYQGGASKIDRKTKQGHEPIRSTRNGWTSPRRPTW